MDKVVEAIETAKKEWDEAHSRAKEHTKAIEGYGTYIWTQKMILTHQTPQSLRPISTPYLTKI